MTANLPENGHEPADLSQLAATDALLDRLGGREPADDDLDDAAVTALFQLVAFVDECREPDLGLARLVEVLDGRPLYVTGPEEASEPAELDRSAAVTPASADADPTVTRVIDLTDHHRPDPLKPVAALAAEPAEVDDEPAGDLVAVRSIRSAAGAKKADAAAQRWDRALHHAALPAAAVIALFALGSGVSAAVTGDPMSPVNGVSRVMAQLPGVDDSQSKVSEVRGEISAADQAVRRHDESSASRHLANARKALADVPAASKAGLQLAIANVENALGGPTLAPVVQVTTPTGIQGTGGPTSAPGNSSGSGGPVGVTSPPAGVPVTSTPASTTTPPTADPTTTPEAAPSEAPTTPESVRSTAAVPVDPSPAEAASES